jgi:hypothetical protein
VAVINTKKTDGSSQVKFLVLTISGTRGPKSLNQKLVHVEICNKTVHIKHISPQAHCSVGSKDFLDAEF